MSGESMSSSAVVAPAQAADFQPGELLLKRILAEGRVVRNLESRFIGDLQAYLDEVVSKHLAVGGDLRVALRAFIAELDQKISNQLDEVLHNENFQRLEAAWRGVRWLVKHAEKHGSSEINIELLHATKHEIIKDYEWSSNRSAFRKHIYDQRLGVYGGKPVGAVICGYYFGNTSRDLDLLRNISGDCAIAHAPFIASAGPDMFGKTSFAEVAGMPKIGNLMAGEEFNKWRSLRDEENSRYIGLTLPCFLGREPYSSEAGSGSSAFKYQESVDGTDHKKYLWVSSAYAYAERLVASFAETGWIQRIRGTEGGQISNLPLHTFLRDGTNAPNKCPTEVNITREQERDLSLELGFLPLIHEKDSDRAVFMSGQSIQLPRNYNKDSAQASANLSARLSPIFAASRITHHIINLLDSMVGMKVSRGEMEKKLNNWLSYFIGQTDLKPLRDGKVTVVEDKRNPGIYSAVCYLVTPVELEGVNINMRLVGQLSPSQNEK